MSDKDFFYSSLSGIKLSYKNQCIPHALELANQKLAEFFFFSRKNRPL
jgi:hypothetical protein